MTWGRTIFHYFNVVAGRQLPQTQTTEAERAALASYLPGRKRVVEIGVYEGFTTRLLARSADPDAVIYGVDPFFAGRIGISWGLKIAEAYNGEFIRSGKLKLVRRFSTQVGDLVPAPVDYVFIDADHSLDGITADWAFWSDRVASGGIIGLHDVLIPADRPEMTRLGSHQYFESHISSDSRFDIVCRQDSLVVLKKK